ncbi:hypothetical protein HYW55_03800 [Candidatus Gottesmanbacteria bacterium]|nr:hypothetical protein [Candidatus Gottesmanbacteria bacterium]
MKIRINLPGAIAGLLLFLLASVAVGCALAPATSRRATPTTVAAATSAPAATATNPPPAATETPPAVVATETLPAAATAVPPAATATNPPPAATATKEPPAVTSTVIAMTSTTVPTGTPSNEPPPTETTAPPKPTETPAPASGGNAPWVEQQGETDSDGYVTAGKEFFATEFKKLSDGFFELVYATNNDRCNDPTVFTWILKYKPLVTRIESGKIVEQGTFPQWAECTRLNVSGMEAIVITVKNVSSGDVHFGLTGVGAMLGTEEVTESIPVDIKPGETKILFITLDVTGGYVSLERVPNQLIAGGTFQKDDRDGKWLITHSSQEAQPCAWSALWLFEPLSGDATLDVPVCLKPVITGTGKYKITVWPWDEEGGYRTANQSGLGMAFWPTGRGFSCDVTKKDGTIAKGVKFGTGSEGIDVPLAGGPRTLTCELKDGYLELPYGDITKDKVTSKVIRPKY